MVMTVQQLNTLQKRFFDAAKIGDIQAIKDVMRDAQEELLELDAVLSDGRFWRMTNPFSPRNNVITEEIRRLMWEFIESVLDYKPQYELLLRWALRTYQPQEIIEEYVELCPPFLETVEGLTVIQEACFFYSPQMVEKLLHISIHCEDIWIGIENALFPQNIQRKLLFYLKNYLEKTSEKELEHVLFHYPKSLIKLIGLLLSNPNSSGMAFTAIFTVIFKMLNNPQSSETSVNPFSYLLCLSLTGNRGTTLNYLYTFYPALVKQLFNSYPLAVYLLLKYSLNHTTKGIRDLIICDKYAFDKLLQQTLLQEDSRVMFFLITASGQGEDKMTYENWLQTEWPKEQHKLITPKYTLSFYQPAGAEPTSKKFRTDQNSFFCTEKFNY